MKRALWILAGLVFVFVANAAILSAVKQPTMRPASNEKVDITPERLARGEYLVETLLSCAHCHTAINPTRWSATGDKDKRGAGGLCWGDEQGFPGMLCTKNITPDPETGLGQWSDGEIMRAIREGISRDGTPMYPIMPYTEYRLLPDDDVKAIVAYLRGMKPVKNVIPARELKVPLNIIVKFIPKPLEGPVPAVPTSDPIAYGKYLATVGGCHGCHSPVDDQHQLVVGKEFSGGQTFKFQGISVRSANLTPHETGLGGKTKEMFIGQFRAFAGPQMWDVLVEPAANTVMPWLTLARAADLDLGAMFAYLATLPPIANVVEKHPAPVAPRVE